MRNTLVGPFCGRLMAETLEPMSLQKTLRELLAFGVFSASAGCCSGLFSGAALMAQNRGSSGPQTPSKLPEIKRIPLGGGVVEKPPIPPEEIVRQFAAHEDELAKVAAGYSYRRVIRVEEFGPD